MSNHPIGIFDSGVGGLTIWRAIKNKLPKASIIYVADQKNCPYGNKNQDEIFKLTEKCVEFLIDKSCKIIIIACNTATAVAIHELRKKHRNILFVGLEPAVKPAAVNTQKGVIGVLATENTLIGKHYLETSQKYGNNAKINEVAGNGLVELIERGNEKEKLEKLLLKYLRLLDYKNIDYLVLGCTHYPLAYTEIQKICGDAVNIIDSAGAVARQVEKLLLQSNITVQTTTRLQFFTTGELNLFKKFLFEKILNDDMSSVETASIAEVHL